MKTVLLINSPLHEKPSATQDRYIPPFGLYYIAAELRKQNINVIVRDCVFEGISIDNLVKEINTERYNLNYSCLFRQSWQRPHDYCISN